MITLVPSEVQPELLAFDPEPEAVASVSETVESAPSTSAPETEVAAVFQSNPLAGISTGITLAPSAVPPLPPPTVVSFDASAYYQVDISDPTQEASQPSATVVARALSFSSDVSSVLPFRVDGADISRSLEVVREVINQQLSVHRFEVAESAGLAVSLSVGYVSWLLRGGVLLSSVMSSLPVWRFIDPLPVFSGGHAGEEEGDDESLAGIMESGAGDRSPAHYDEPDQGVVVLEPAADSAISSSSTRDASAHNP